MGLSVFLTSIKRFLVLKILSRPVTLPNAQNMFLWWDWWGTYFNCSLSESRCKTLKNDPSNMSLEGILWHSIDLAMDDECYNLYNAVYAVAHVFHQMSLQQSVINVMERWTELTNKCTEVQCLLVNDPCFLCVSCSQGKIVQLLIWEPSLQITWVVYIFTSWRIKASLLQSLL